MRAQFHFSPWPIATTLCAIGLAVGVFMVTQSVQQRENSVAELNRQLLSEQQALRVLDAEWAYLTRPQRLEDLVAMKSEHAVMPPAPTPIATMVPQVATQEQAPAVAEKVQDEQPAAQPAQIAEKPAVKKTQKTAAKKQDTKTASGAKSAAKPAVRQAKAKTPAVTQVKAKTPAAVKARDKGDDMVWSIARKTPRPAAQPVARVSASAYRPTSVRAVARPIVE